MISKWQGTASSWQGLGPAWPTLSYATGAAHQKCAELQKVIEDSQINLQQEEQKADSQSSVPSNVEGIKQEEATIITGKQEKTEDRMSILESQL